MNALNMELAHSLTLNINILERLPEHKKSIFVYEWLRFIQKVLSAARKADIKDKQDEILEHIISQLMTSNGLFARHTLSYCLTSIFIVGDTSKLFDVMNRLTDIIKTNDNSASFIARRLASICCIGIICQRLGRMVGRSYDTAVSSLIKGYKTAESQTRCESLLAFGRIIQGLGNVASNVQRDIVKIAKNGLNDRFVPVRIAAVACLKLMAEGLPFVPSGANGELDAIVQQSSRVVMLEPGTSTAGAVGCLCSGFSELQRSTADLLAFLVHEAGSKPAATFMRSPSNSTKYSLIQREDALLLLGNLFTRGTGSSASATLRSADLLTARATSVSHELRFEIAHTYIEYIRLLGSRWLSHNLAKFLDHICMVCSAATRFVLSGGESAHQQHIDLLVVRRCILHILSSTVGLMLSEPAQIAALLHLSNYVLRNLSISRNEVSTDGAAAPSGESMVDSAIVMVVSPNTNSSSSGADSNTTNKFTASSKSNVKEIPAVRRHQEQEQHFVHTVVCSLIHMGSLTTLVGDAIVLNSSLFSISNMNSPILEALFASLAHSSNSIRTSACLCLRAIALSYPPALVPLLDRCASILSDTHDVQLTTESIFGYGTAVASLIAAASSSEEHSRNTPSTPGEVGSPAMFGLSPSTIKRMFDLAVHMLHCVPLTLRLSEARASVAYLMLGAIVRHSALAVRPLLPRLLALCLRVFPKTGPTAGGNNEAENTANGNSFTWQVMMEARTVVLTVLEILVNRWAYLFPSTIDPNQTSLGTTSTDLYLKLLALVHRAVIFVDQLPNISRSHGGSIKLSAAAYRSRLYVLLNTVLQAPTHGTPSTAVSGLVSNPASLLREAVADLTLVEPVGYNTASAAPLLFSSLGQSHLNLLLTLGSNSTIMLDFPPALEHDPSILISQTVDPSLLVTSTWQIGSVPRSTNLVCNAARLLAVVLPNLPAKHRLQILNHFGEAIRQTRAGQLRQQAIQCNLLAVLLLYFRYTTNNKTPYSPDWLSCIVSLISDAIDSRIPLIRSAGCEALGRLSVAIGDPRYAADLRQSTTDRLRSSRDMNTRICQSLALGAIMCQCGAANHAISPSALQHCIGLLLGLAQDHTATSVQAAALHALAVTLDSNGYSIRSYAESLVTLIVSILLNAFGTSTTVQGSTHLPQLAARCLNAIITTLGPELSANTSVMDEARSCILTALSALMNSNDRGLKLSPESAYAQAEALSCYQQLHLFAPRHVSLLTLVPKLFDILALSQQQVDVLDSWSSCTAIVTSKSSPLVVVRRAAAGCLRQLAQREPLDLIEHASHYGGNEGKLELESQLFGLLDIETDSQLRSDIHETLISLLQNVSTVRLSIWLLLIRDVLSKTSVENSNNANQSAQSANSLQNSLKTKKNKSGQSSAFGADQNNDDDDDDEEETEEGASFGPVSAEDPNPSLLPRWRSRVFAVKCLIRLMDSCHATGDSRHFDLNQARSAEGNCWLVLYLSDIVRLVSLAATHPCLSVRLAGLAAMRSMIRYFAESQDPELPPNSSLLEQYQAQMGASLRPAFASDAPAYITAEACDVCSAWLASGITREPSDLMRIHILLVGMLSRLEKPSGTKQKAPVGYTQATEMFGVLRAWAEVYVEADSREVKSLCNTNNDDDEDDMANSDRESLVALVAPNLELLGPLWLNVLRDYALLALVGKAESSNDNNAPTMSYLTENLETADARRLCIAAFPAVVQAASLWLISSNSTSNSTSSSPIPPDDASLLLILGSCAGTLCERLNIDPPLTLIACLRALSRLFACNWAATRFAEDFVIVRELLQITYRLLLVRELTQKLQPSVVSLARAIATSLANCFHRNPAMSFASSQTMTASPSLLGLTLVGQKNVTDQPSSSSHSVPFSGDVIVAERVLLAIAHRVLSPQLNQPASTLTETAELAASVLELLGSLPSLLQCHPTTTPSIIALMTRAIQTAAFQPDFPQNITSTMSSTVHRLVAIISEHNIEESPSPLAGIMIWRLAEQMLTTISESSQINTASQVIILINCFLIPLSAPCPTGLIKCPEHQFEQISKVASNIMKRSFNSDQSSDAITAAVSLKRLVECVDLTSYPSGGSPFAADLITVVLSTSMHSLCTLLLKTDASNLGSGHDSLKLLATSVALIRGVVEFLALSSPKNKTELLEMVFQLFATAALIHKQSFSTKLVVPILSDSISSIATANPMEFKSITARSPSLRQQLQQVLTGASANANQQTALRQNDSNGGLSSATIHNKINLKMDFSHHMSSSGSLVDPKIKDKNMGNAGEAPSDEANNQANFTDDDFDDVSFARFEESSDQVEDSVKPDENSHEGTNARFDISNNISNYEVEDIVPPSPTCIDDTSMPVDYDENAS